MESLIKKCQLDVDNDCCLWIAFQCNVTNDISYTTDGFETACNRMLEDLETECGWYRPLLSKNMRNNRSIATSTKNLAVGDGYPISILNDVVAKLDAPETTLKGEKPKLFPLPEKDFDKNALVVLKEIFKRSDWHLLRESKKFKFIVLHSLQFKGKDLKRLFENFFDANDIITHDEHPNDCDRETLRSFLDNPQSKLGIFCSKFVPGMEGSNLIYFFGNDFRYDEGIRCSLTRAVSELTLIQKVSNDYFTATDLSSFSIVNDYIECKGGFKNGDRSLKCTKCRVELICSHCAIRCHNGHQTKVDRTISDDVTKCKCTNC